MKKIYWLILSLSVLACQKLPEGPQDIPDTPYVPRTELGKMVAKAPSVAHIYADSTFLLATGVDETDIHFQTSENSSFRTTKIRMSSVPARHLRI